MCSRHLLLRLLRLLWLLQAGCGGALYWGLAWVLHEVILGILRRGLLSAWADGDGQAGCGCEGCPAGPGGRWRRAVHRGGAWLNSDLGGAEGLLRAAERSVGLCGVLAR